MSPGDIQLILQRLDQIDSTLERILSEATKTNGRVTRLEAWKNRMEGAHDALGSFRAVGIIVAAGVLVAALTGAFAYLASH
ncbi:MAG: hypothetical protein ACR2JV_01980 [Gaiellales bacterium]